MFFDFVADPDGDDAYCRVSTTKQETEGQALDRYREDFLSAGIRPDRIFSDVESGGSATREGLNAVLDRCRAGITKRIIVPEDSRLHRSVRLWEDIRDELLAYGIKLIELSTGREIDIYTAEGIYESQVRAAMHERHRRAASQHSLRGFDRRQKNKLPHVCPFGYKIIGGRKNSRMVINNDRYGETDKTYFEVVREAIDLFLETGSYSKTVRALCERYGYDRLGAKELDFPRSQVGFSEWIKSPVLRGHLVHYPGNRRSPDTVFPVQSIERIDRDNHEAIISPELDRLIQQKISAIAPGIPPKEVRNPLARILFCSCGASMSSVRKSDKYGSWDYYFCSGAYPKPGKPRTCDRRKYLKQPRAIDAVIDALVLKAEEVSRWSVSDMSEPAIESEEERELKRKIAQLEALSDPDLEEIITMKRTRLTVVRENLVRGRSMDGDRIELYRSIAGDPEFWRQLPVDRQKIHFRTLVRRVAWDGNSLTIDLF